MSRVSNDNKTTLRMTRTKVLAPCRVNEEEKEKIKSRATAAGLSVSEFQRDACLHTEIVIHESKHDAKLVRQLLAIGNNLNQLTKLSHSLFDYDRLRLNECLDQLDLALNKVLG